MRRGRNWKSATTPLPKLRVVDRSPLVTLRNSIIENPQFDHLSFETLLELRESLREHAETLRNFRFFERAKRVNLIERKLDKKIQEECESLRDYGASPAKPMRRPKEALMRRQHEQILADFEGVWATEMYAKFHKGEDPEREEAEYEANYAQAREHLMQRFAAEMSAFDSPEKPFVVLNVNKPVKRPVVTPSIARFAQISRGKDRIVQPEIMRKTLPLAEERLRFTSTEVFVPHSPRNILDEKEDEENVELSDERLKFVSTEVFVPSSPRNILEEKEDEENVELSDERLKFVSTEVFVPSSPRNVLDENEEPETGAGNDASETPVPLDEDRLKFISTEVFVPSPRNDLEDETI